jgi:hypothetical protein
MLNARGAHVGDRHSGEHFLLGIECKDENVINKALLG